jgi:hypothetical protein
MPKFCGPFAITGKINDVTFRLDIPAPMPARGIHEEFLAKRLRSYHPDTAFKRYPVVPPLVQFPDGNNEYKVDKIVQYRLHRGNLNF